MKILIAGLGGVGQRHLRNLRTLLGEKAEIAAYRVRGLGHALTDRLEIDPGADVVTKYGVRAFRDLDQALAWGPAAVLVCNPTSLHVEVAMKAARAGCHIFLEKPVADRWEGIPELVAESSARGLITLIGYQLRWHPCLVKLRSWVEAGLVGKVISVRAEIGEYLPGWHPYEDFRQMYAARADLGGGVVLSQIHELDYLGWIFGWPGRVFAQGGSRSRLGLDVEDTADLLLEVESPRGPLSVGLHMDYIQRPPSRSCRVVGDGGLIDLDLRAGRIRRFDGEGGLAEEADHGDHPRNQLFLDELAHFLDCVKTGHPSRIPLEEGVRSLRVALAAKRSMKTGQTVDLVGG